MTDEKPDTPPNHDAPTKPTDAPKARSTKAVWYRVRVRDTIRHLEAKVTAKHRDGTVDLTYPWNGKNIAAENVAKAQSESDTPRWTDSPPAEAVAPKRRRRGRSAD